MYISKKSSTFAVAMLSSFSKSGAKVLQKIRIRKKIVKNHQSYWVLLLAVLISGTMNAKVNSYMGVYAAAGEWSLIPTQSEYSVSLGAAGGLGFLYEMQVGPTYGKTRFLFDVGLGADYGLTAFNVTKDQTQIISDANGNPVLQEDLQYDEFYYVYQLNGRKDQYTNLAVRVPIMVGLQHKQFYMLAGVKLGVNLLPTVHTKASLTTYGDYVEFDNYRNMPEYQFFEGLPFERKTKAGFDFKNLDVSFEIGGRLGLITDATGFDVPKSKVEYRLAAYVDYGVLDMHKAGDKDAMKTPQAYDAAAAYNPYKADGSIGDNRSMVDALETNDILSTKYFANSTVHNFMVGLKFTVLFQLPEPGKCVVCQDAYRSSASRGGGRRGMKYEE